MSAVKSPRANIYPSGREVVLQAVQAALAGVVAEPYPYAVIEPSARLEVLEVNAEQFVAEASAVGAEVFVADDFEAARQQVRRWLAAQKAQRIMCGNTPRVAALEVKSLAPPGCVVEAVDAFASAAERQAALLAADVGINEAEAALADTGTLVEVTAEGCGRLVSLLPPVHLALVSRRNLFPDLATFFHAFRIRERTRASSAITFITGPSRTADIEQILTLGVHGPGVLCIALVD